MTEFTDDDLLLLKGYLAQRPRADGFSEKAKIAALIERMQASERFNEYATHTYHCPVSSDPRGKCECGYVRRRSAWLRAAGKDNPQVDNMGIATKK